MRSPHNLVKCLEVRAPGYSFWHAGIKKATSNGERPISCLGAAGCCRTVGYQDPPRFLFGIELTSEHTDANDPQTF